MADNGRFDFLPGKNELETTRRLHQLDSLNTQFKAFLAEQQAIGTPRDQRARYFRASSVVNFVTPELVPQAEAYSANDVLRNWAQTFPTEESLTILRHQLLRRMGVKVSTDDVSVEYDVDSSDPRWCPALRLLSDDSRMKSVPTKAFHPSLYTPGLPKGFEPAESLVPRINQLWPRTLGAAPSKSDDIQEKYPSNLSGNIVFSWQVSSLGRRHQLFDLTELGLDQHGYPIQLGINKCAEGFDDVVNSHIVLPRSTVSKSINDAFTGNVPWSGRVSGSVWRLKCPGTPSLDLSVAAFLLSQITLPGLEQHPWQCFQFLDCFSGSWCIGNSCDRLGRMACCEIAKGWVTLQYHLRYFTCACGNLPAAPQEEEGLYSLPETGSLTSISGGMKFTFKESRFSIGCSTTINSQFPIYRMVVLQDTPLTSASAGLRGVLSGQPQWAKHGIKPCREGTGVAAFQSAVRNMIDVWTQEWDHTLGTVDELLRCKMDNVLDSPRRGELMFDDSFKRSAMYFSSLQLLRIFGESIRESVGCVREIEEKSIDSLREIFERELEPEVAKRIMEVTIANWESVRSALVQSSEKILARIQSKNDEVKSLRDGLFNATSLREASRGITLNRYILIFTTMTIFYLPLTFVATLFSAHMFDAPEPSRTQTSFYITVVLMSVLTYVLSGSLFLGVTPADQRRGWVPSIFTKRR